MDNQTDLLMYQTEDGETKINVRLEDETVWMTQKAIAELFQTTPQNITLHIKNIFEENEMFEDSTCKDYLQVQIEGSREVKRKTRHYNLEMILAIGYRVRSHRGTQFRQWATERLSEYLVKGFSMDDDRLKEMRNFGQDYFDELLERIRDIRTSEKMYMKDWIGKLNAFLQFNEREILENSGKISAKVAEQVAAQQYEKFNQNRLVKNANSDFDEFIKKNRLK